jgi:cell wall-associated NlpC family hydrolase
MCGATLVSGAAVVGPSAAASVNGSTLKHAKAHVASARQQVARLNSRAEAAAERYNAARIKLAAAQTAAQAAQRKLTSAQAVMDRIERSATAFAVAEYRGTSATSIMSLTSGAPGEFVNRVSALQAISVRESETIDGASAARRALEQAKTNAAAAYAVQRTATAALNADRKQVEAAAAQEKHILGRLEATERKIAKRLAAKRRRRAERIAAERRAARLAAQRAAAARAARAIAAQPVSPPPPPPVTHVPAAGGASTAVAWAYREMGKPYVWGAAGPNSFDCSGLTSYVWAKAGVYLAHFTGDQWNEGTHVSQAAVQPGDLVFFAYNTSDPSTIHHVGLYVGGGEMIDAPYTGAYVRKEPAFRSDYIGAVRPG